ncbi:YccS family putative transporter [Acinetobacter pollinis]|uniref:TIGR01666 family membrane protein n=1 Tax=Acinetobacter pollinis TaxID=2605270 RepID=A0ABU6DSJ1_9GAMM|nr:YccS family putative transporter [Acinetobacter pollinis]MEB5476665.1 TIGR01666 family membrane protein [Acinetobacter pollinis]
MNSFLEKLNQYKSNVLFIYCLQIFIVFSGTLLGLYYIGCTEYIVPVTLGTIAAALTDFDDRLSIRLRNLLYVCILFFITSTILEFLAPYPLLFIVYLSLSSGFLILLGSLGQRYAVISFGTILLSIYTMFGLEDHNVWYFQPICFVLGALWYGMTSILFYLLKPTLFVQDSLAQTFLSISDLLTHKSKLFDPDNNKEQIHNLLLTLSIKNANLVQHLDTTKSALLTRLKASRANKHTLSALHLHFFAQDIHEQAASNYLSYDRIGINFHRSDLIFRIQKTVRLTSQACADLAESILHHRPYKVKKEHTIALAQLESSMHDWIEENPNNREVKNLCLILNNLKNIYEQLFQLTLTQHNEHQHTTHAVIQDNTNLLDNDIQDWNDLVLKFKQHLTPQSALFRHAVRISFVFCIGYGISLLPFFKNGYWILLTSLFVCQVSYFATKSRLKMRTLGTLLGVIIGVPILYFIQNTESQLMLTVICAVLFFYLRVKKYAMATLMATLMVLLIFSLKGSAYEIILPRIIDTLIGCFIAWFAVSFIWPDWQCRNISKNIINSDIATLDYFDEITYQYEYGRDNGMTYRTARRFAHNRQTELANMISSLSAEPNPDKTLIHDAFRYLVLSHSQLSYISALGAHRHTVDDENILSLLQWCSQILREVLIEQSPLSQQNIESKLLEIEILASQQNLSAQLQLTLKQISLLIEMLPEISALKHQLLSQEIK